MLRVLFKVSPSPVEFEFGFLDAGVIEVGKAKAEGRLPNG